MHYSAVPAVGYPHSPLSRCRAAYLAPRAHTHRPIPSRPPLLLPYNEARIRRRRSHIALSHCLRTNRFARITTRCIPLRSSKRQSPRHTRPSGTSRGDGNAPRTRWFFTRSTTSTRNTATHKLPWIPCSGLVHAALIPACSRCHMCFVTAASLSIVTRLIQKAYLEAALEAL